MAMAMAGKRVVAMAMARPVARKGVVATAMAMAMAVAMAMTRAVARKGVVAMARVGCIVIV
jgi:hypothetical protein